MLRLSNIHIWIIGRKMDVRIHPSMLVMDAIGTGDPVSFSFFVPEGYIAGSRIMPDAIFNPIL